MFSKLATRTFTINTNSSPNSRQGSIYGHPKTDFTDLDRLYENARQSDVLLSDDVPSSPSSTALPEHECVLTPTYATRSAEDPTKWIARANGWALAHSKSSVKKKWMMRLAKSLIGNKVTDPMTATFFEQRASYFLANNKRDTSFTVDAVGVFQHDTHHHVTHESDSPTSPRSNFFMSSDSSSSEDDDVASYSDASEGTSASSTEDQFGEELYHIEKGVNMTARNDLIVQNETERVVLYQDHGSQNLLSQSPRQYDSILTAAAENDQPLPLSLSDASPIADVSQDGMSITVKTGPSGFFQDNIIIPDTLIRTWSERAVNPRIIRIKAKSNDSCSADCFGQVNLLEPEGISIVSDIDDTIKDTQVLCGAKTVLRNTFFKAAQPVDGMADTYKSLYDHGLDFHYVSNSPFQLVSMLKDFLHENNFPLGSFHLRMSGNPLARFTETPGQAKRDSVLQIMQDFPQRKFIFIGDSGEIDLEIYSRIAREQPGRVLKIFIRDVTTTHMHRKASKKAESYDTATASSLMKISLGTRRLSLGRQTSSNSADSRLEGEACPIADRGLPRNNSFTSMSTSSPSTRKSMIDLIRERIKKAQAELPDDMISLFTTSQEITSDPIVQQAMRDQALHSN